MAKKRILVVDDSKTSLMMAQMILKRHPFEVLTAEDGRAGVEKAVAEKPDLILMDVVMPNMDGFSAVKAIRSIESLRDTPIIMVTTRGEADNVERGYGEGCNDYVTKPIDGPELLAKIANLIGA